LVKSDPASHEETIPGFEIKSNGFENQAIFKIKRIATLDEVAVSLMQVAAPAFDVPFAPDIWGVGCLTAKTRFIYSPGLETS
jgi:hypothetical protein